MRFLDREHEGERKSKQWGEMTENESIRHFVPWRGGTPT